MLYLLGYRMKSSQISTLACSEVRFGCSVRTSLWQTPSSDWDGQVVASQLFDRPFAFPLLALFYITHEAILKREYPGKERQRGRVYRFRLKTAVERRPRHTWSSNLRDTPRMDSRSRALYFHASGRSHKQCRGYLCVREEGRASNLGKGAVTLALIQCVASVDPIS